MIDSELLTFLPTPTHIRECPVMLITDCPLANEIQVKTGYSSQKAKIEFMELSKVGIPRTAVHATYLMNFRPEKGELSALFWNKTLDSVDGYVSWGSEKNCFILDYAFNELQRLKEEIHRTKPELILISGKWSLFFLTNVVKLLDTKKSSYGTLLKWRASSLSLSPWWEYEQEHIVFPMLPIDSRFSLPDNQYLVKWDMERIRNLYKGLLAGELASWKYRTEDFIIPESNNSYGSHEFFLRCKDTLVKLLNMAEEPTPFWLSIDVETIGYAYIDCFSIAWSPSEAICIPFASIGSAHYWTELQELELFSLCWELLLHKNVKHIGQNYSYDMQYFWRNMLLQVAPSMDTMIQGHVMFSTMEKGLGFLSSLYCKQHYWWKDEGKIGKNTTNIERWLYNCKDTTRTYEIAFKQKEMFDNSPPSLQEALRFQTFDNLPFITNVMKRGVRQDERLKLRLIDELQTRAHSISTAFQEIFDEPVNINSPDQLKGIFYELFHCKKQWKQTTDANGIERNVLTLDEEALETLYSEEILLRPIIDILLDYKKLSKTASGIKSLSLDVDSRLRCSYNVCGTDTYRYSSNANAFGTGTNLQVISKGKKLRNGEYLPNSKRLFLPDPGMTYFDIDLTAADAHIVAWQSDCKELQEIMLAGEDLYLIVAKEYYRNTNLTKKSEERQEFKGVIHASHYAGSASGIAERFGLLTVEVERIQRYYFGRFPEVKQELVRLEQEVRRTKRITNIFGFQRWFFNLQMKTLIQTAAAWRPQCLSKRHKVITNKGLVPINEITLTDLVAIWDIETKKIYWECPTALHEGEASVIQIKGSIELEATLNHKIPYHTGDNIKNRARELQDLPPQARIPLTGYIQDIGTNWSAAKGAFLAAYQADGWYDRKRNVFQFEFRKDRKIELLSGILDSLGAVYTKTLVRRNAISFYIKNANTILDPSMKESSEFILNIGTEAIQAYINNIKEWDGHYNKKLGVVEYWSSRRSHIDYLKILVHLQGGRAREYSPDIRGNKPCYRLNFNFSRVNAGLAYCTKKVLEKQPVYCLTTRTGFFLTELNGCISVTGNSTVAIIINKGGVIIDRTLPDVQVLMQTHDSLSGQFPTNMPELKDKILQACSIELPYSRPLTIPVNIGTSEISWGDIE